MPKKAPAPAETAANAVDDAAPALASPAPASVGGYATIDAAEAAQLLAAGAHPITITRRFPDNPFKPGKRYVFRESQADVDALLARAKAQEAA